MTTRNLILVETFCNTHHIEVSFLSSLEEVGLVTIEHEEDGHYLTEDQLSSAERMLRLHQDLQINLEGLEAVMHLLDRLHERDNEISALRNRLRFYED